MAEQHDESTVPEGIFNFAYFPYKGSVQLERGEAASRGWPDAVESLAKLAEPEDWSGHGKTSPTSPPYGILKKYIQYTYQRLVMEGKVFISANGDYATFNTGLLTRHGVEIFGFFNRNRREGVQPWFFHGWVTESNGALMAGFPQGLPEMAQYVDSAADLVYDVRRKLTLDVDHIIGENLHRFPQVLRGNEGWARSSLNSAKDMTLKRVRRNYKIAIPQWFPTLGRSGAQLLLPLDLTHTGTADLALVVSPTAGGAYRGNTVLTLEMAYSNARLVARPDSEWLTPQVDAD